MDAGPCAPTGGSYNHNIRPTNLVSSPITGILAAGVSLSQTLLPCAVIILASDTGKGCQNRSEITMLSPHLNSRTSKFIIQINKLKHR